MMESQTQNWELCVSSTRRTGVSYAEIRDAVFALFPVIVPQRRLHSQIYRRLFSPILLAIFLFKILRPSCGMIYSFAAGFFTVVLVGCGGGGTGTSRGSPVNTVPSISSISPSTVLVGSSATTLYVYGSNFNSGTAVL